MRPTDEQLSILDAFKTGEDVSIEAGAGTGKSSILRMVARSDLDLSGLYLAFNRSIADEARRSFPGTTACMTSHALAMRSGMAARFEERINSGRVQSRELASWLGVHRFFRAAKGRRDVSTWKIASLAAQTVKRYCQSGDEQVLPRHVPYVIAVERERQDELRRVVLPYARRIWDDVVSDDPRLAFGNDHLDHALKLYALSDPTLSFDYLLVDEAQDTNGVLSGLVERQSSKDVQVVVTGDSSQQLYRWRGAHDFLTSFEAAHRLSLTLSFRFGPAIAEEANHWLRYLDAPIRLRGLESIDSSVGAVERPAAVLCRTNAEVVEQAMAAQRAGVSVAIIGGAGGIAAFAQAADDLKRGERPSHPELSMFKTWLDVVAYVEEEQPGGSLGTYVRLIERYGVQKVLEVASGCAPEGSAERQVGTVHAVKGLEWSSVLVDPGMMPAEPGEKDEQVDRDALHVCYVAVTRAKERLDARGIAGYHRRRDSLRVGKMRRAMLAVV